MTAKHTPTPWVSYEGENFAEFIVRAVNNHDDMLAALKAALAYIEANVCDPDITDEMAQAWAALQDADLRGTISKAEGEHQ